MRRKTAEKINILKERKSYSDIVEKKMCQKDTIGTELISTLIHGEFVKLKGGNYRLSSFLIVPK